MKKFFLALFLAFAHLVMYGQLKNDSPAIKGFRIVDNTILLDSAGKPIDLGDTYTDIYSDGNLTLYDLVYTYSSSYHKIQLIENEIRHHYFIFAKDSLYGLDFNGYKEQLVSRHKVDSIIGKMAISSLDMKQFFTDFHVKLIDTEPAADSINISYQFTHKYDSSQKGSCALSYKAVPVNDIFYPMKGPEHRIDISIYKIKMLLETCTCHFEITHTQTEIIPINSMIRELFSEYYEKATFNASYKIADK